MNDRFLQEALERVKRNPSDPDARQDLEKALARVPVAGEPSKKKCQKCKRTKPTDQFGTFKSSKNGKTYRRKTCNHCSNRARERSRTRVHLYV